MNTVWKLPRGTVLITRDDRECEGNFSCRINAFSEGISASTMVWKLYILLRGPAFDAVDELEAIHDSKH